MTAANSDRWFPSADPSGARSEAVRELNYAQQTPIDTGEADFHLQAAQLHALLYIGDQLSIIRQFVTAPQVIVTAPTDMERS